MNNFRIFKVGSRVELRGLTMEGTGTVMKIGRLRATVHMDTPFADQRRNDRCEQKTLPSFEYKHLRLLDNFVRRVEVHSVNKYTIEG